MARTALGIGILVALLLLGSFAAIAMDRIHLPIATLLQQAADQPLEEGILTAQKAKVMWEKYWQFSATLADHSPMDEIDGLFAQLEAYQKAGLSGDFSACCLRLSMLVEAVAEAHRFTWWNLL